MRRDKEAVLSEDQVFGIKNKAAEARQFFGVFQNVPIGNDIRLFLEKKGILLCEYPFSDSGDTHTYGNITWFRTDDEAITFIGLNTASYYDEQIFALAHEIYHFITRTGTAYSQDIDHEDSETEKMADRFAAEFLLPADALRENIFSVFDKTELKNVPDNRLLRFAARIQCDWWLPYRAIINRLYEEGHISRSQYDTLFDTDCRSEDSVYRRILKSTDNEISELLNTRTRTVGVSYKVIDAIISNYEDGLIDDDEFIRLFALFDKKPEDYGIQIKAEPDEELMEMMESGEGG
ncbi:MAG: ImmA/IrrE family metallo-endopeptidase [Lachnospiraceae bacterium]|nr:ImmA/IrrE family metallo-endopeptidase [Lachnospiraceae bacterium]